MDTHLSLEQIKKEWHGSFKSYLIGFLLSLALTVTSFLIVIYKPISDEYLVYTILFLGLTQAIIQLIFFLHLGKEEKPRWETWIFLFMVLILVIIVAGTLWIMNDLNERTMSYMTKEMLYE